MPIIDAHAHIFSRIDGRNHSGVTSSGEYGLIIKTTGSEPFMPPFGTLTGFTVNNLLAFMDQNGVEKALLLQNPTIGTRNGELADAVSAYPERFAAVIQTDPFSPGAVDELDRWTAEGAFKCLKLEMSQGWGWTGIHKNEAFDYQMLRPLIERAGSLGLHVIIDTGDYKSRSYDPEGLEKLFRQFPRTRFIIEHLGFFVPGTPQEKWEALIRLGLLDNVHIGIAAAAHIAQEDYPCAETQKRLEKAYRLFGAEKLFWGSDCPGSFKSFTYKQMIDQVLYQSDFLSSGDKEKILYENAQELFFR
ncbi:amidohydrolase [Spirochaetia bacterium]|nr:amidohydrolase [Spirochaetia bacterium]